MNKFIHPDGKSIFSLNLRRRIISVITIMVMAATLCAYAAPSKWEPAKGERHEAKTIVRDSETEIRVGRGIILVNSSKPVQIKVYTILGQLVSKENLPPGSSQLSVQAHGLYIIKTPDLTCKAAL